MHSTGEDDSLALKKKVTIDDVFGPDLQIHDPDAKWLSGEWALWHLASASHVKTRHTSRHIMIGIIVAHDSEYTISIKIWRPVSNCPYSNCDRYGLHIIQIWKLGKNTTYYRTYIIIFKCGSPFCSSRSKMCLLLWIIITRKCNQKRTFYKKSVAF